MRLLPWEERTVSQQDIEASLKPELAKLAGARARVTSGNSLGLRRGSDGGISMALTGPNYPDLAVTAQEFADRLEETPGLSRIRVQYQATQPQLSIGVDRAKAADLGVPMTELSSTLRALVTRRRSLSLLLAIRQFR